MASITHTEARERIASLLERLGHAEAADKVCDYTYIDISSSLRSDDATVYVNEKLDFSDEADRDAVSRIRVEYRVEINSPTTIRTIAQSVAFMDTFKEAISLAAKIQALTESFPTVFYVSETPIPPEADYV